MNPSYATFYTSSSRQSKHAGRYWLPWVNASPPLTKWALTGGTISCARETKLRSGGCIIINATRQANISPIPVSLRLCYPWRSLNMPSRSRNQTTRSNARGTLLVAPGAFGGTGGASRIVQRRPDRIVFVGSPCSCRGRVITTSANEPWVDRCCFY